MDIIENRIITLNKNILEKHKINIKGQDHQLTLKKTGRVYLVTLEYKDIEVGSKTFITKVMAYRYYNKLLNKYNGGGV